MNNKMISRADQKRISTHNTPEELLDSLERASRNILELYPKGKKSYVSIHSEGSKPMTHKEILGLLADNNIPGVVIGGTALRLYGSSRVTHDIDVAVPILEIDTIISLMYKRGYFLVARVNEKTCTVVLGAEEALDWLEREKAGAVSFIEISPPPGETEIPHKLIDITTQVDFLLEPGIPFTKLIAHARQIDLDTFSFHVAAPEDLLIMKENRRDKNEADRADIEFLEELIRES